MQCHCSSTKFNLPQCRFWRHEKKSSRWDLLNLNLVNNIYFPFSSERLLLSSYFSAFLGLIIFQILKPIALTFKIMYAFFSSLFLYCMVLETFFFLMLVVQHGSVQFKQTLQLNFFFFVYLILPPPQLHNCVMWGLFLFSKPLTSKHFMCLAQYIPSY